MEAASSDAADDLRKRLEDANPEHHFRVYAQTMSLAETSRTMRPGDAWWHAVQYESRHGPRWAVLPVTEESVTDPDRQDYDSLRTEHDAQQLALLRNRLPEGYSARYALIRNWTHPEGRPGYEVAATKEDWLIQRPADQIDVLLGDVEGHAAGTEERARVREEQAAQKQAREEAQATEQEWVRRHGPRVTEAQHEFIVTLRERLADLGGADTVSGPTDDEGIHNLTKAQASLYIDVLKSQLEDWEDQRAKRMFAVIEPAADDPAL